MELMKAFLVCALVINCLLQSTNAASKATVTLLHFNDINSQLKPFEVSLRLRNERKRKRFADFGFDVLVLTSSKMILPQVDLGEVSTVSLDCWRNTKRMRQLPERIQLE